VKLKTKDIHQITPESLRTGVNEKAEMKRPDLNNK